MRWIKWIGRALSAIGAFIMATVKVIETWENRPQWRVA